MRKKPRSLENEKCFVVDIPDSKNQFAMKLTIVLIIFFIIKVISGETDFDPVVTITKACNLQPYSPCPHCWRSGSTEKKATAIHLQILVQRFINLNDVDESFEFTGAIVLFWMDDCLRNTYQNRSIWKNEEIKSLYFTDVRSIWTPDVIHLNSLSNSAIKDGKFEFRSFLNFTLGMGTAVIYGNFKSHCDLNFLNFPFDKQSCQFSITIGTNSDSTSIASQKVTLEYEAIPENSNWDMTHLAFDKISSSSTPIATMVAKMTRNPVYFISNLFVPSMVLSILEMFSFFIPADCGGDRPSFAGTILLSMYLIHTQVLSYIPKTPKPVTISSYVLGIIGHATSCTVYAAVSSWLAHKHVDIFKRKIRIGARKVTLMSIVDAIAFCIAIGAFIIMNVHVVVSIGAFSPRETLNKSIEYSPMFE